MGHHLLPLHSHVVLKYIWLELGGNNVLSGWCLHNWAIFMVYSFAMVAIQSIHLITSLVNCLSYIFYRYLESDGNVPWSWKTAGFNCILLCFWIKNRFFHDLVALFIVVYSNNNNSCAFWIPYHLQLWGCCSRLPCQISYYM